MRTSFDLLSSRGEQVGAAPRAALVFTSLGQRRAGDNPPYPRQLIRIRFAAVPHAASGAHLYAETGWGTPPIR